MVGLDFLFHLGLDLLKILRRDAVGKLDIVIETVLDGRAGGELGVGPEPENGGGHDMGAGMAQALQVGHFLAVVQCLSFVIHIKILSAN